MDTRDDDTSEYSSTQAPETAEHVEEHDPLADHRLIPGGAPPRTDSQQGMAGLDREDLPGGATDGGRVVETGRRQGVRGD